MAEHAFPQEPPQSGPDQTFNFKVKDDDIVDNSSWFISKIFGQLTSIAHVFLEWMALLTPYCLTFAVACYLLGPFSVVLGKVRENVIVILYNLRMFISMIFKVLTSRRYWENICVILENLCWFCLQILEASKNFAHSCFKWITVLASLILLRVWGIIIFILENLRIIIATIFEVLTNIRYWEISCAILESLCFFTLQISDALINITHSFLEFIRLLASCRSTVSCYLFKSITVVVVRVWEIMVAILDNLHIFTAMMFEVFTNIRYWEISCTIADNLRLFILKISDALTSITHHFLEFICLLVSCCSTVSCYLFKSISVVVVRVWEIMVAILDNLRIFTAIMFEMLTNIRYWEISCTIADNLRLFILKISDALTSITHHFLEFICLLVSCCSTVSCYLFKSISVVVVSVWKIMVAILDNLRIYTAMMFEVLTNIRYWKITCAILNNMRLFILKISNVLASISYGCLQWIYLLAPYCLTVPCYLIESISVVLTRLRDIMVASLDNLRIFTSMMLEVLTNIRYWGISRAILDNLRLFISKTLDSLTSFTHCLLEYIYILASYCLTVPCYVLKSISVVVVKVWKRMVVILNNLRIFTAMMFEVLTNIRYWETSCATLNNLRLLILKISSALKSIIRLFLECIHILASFCLTVPCYVLKSISDVVFRLWKIMVAILDNLSIFSAMIFEVLTNIRHWDISCSISDNLRLFILKILDASSSFTGRFLEWICLLALYCLTVPCYVSTVVAKLWEIITAILNYLHLFILKISDALTGITHRSLEWISLLPSYCLTVPCYVQKSISVVVAKLWEILAAISDNLRLFIWKIPEALTSIIDLLLKWINLPASYCMITVPCFVLKSISVVAAKLWEIMMGILNSLRLFIIGINDALTSITDHLREWINLLALYCVTIPFFVLKSISAVVARLCEIMVANLDNLRLFIMKVSDKLTSITHRFLEWIIRRMYDNDHCGNKEGDQPVEGKTLTARFIS